MEQYEQYNGTNQQNEQQEEPGIRREEAFPVAPLKLSGVFGIGWQLYKRGVGATFLLTLALMGTLMLLIGLAMMPLIDWSMELTMPGGYDASDIMMSGAFRMLGAIPAMMALSLLSTFLISPMYAGTVYQEMHDRAEGRVKSVGRLFKSLGAGMKKIYTTMLVMLLISAGLGFVLGLIMTVIMVGSAFSIGLSGASPENLLGTVIILYAVILVATILFSAFLLYMYPANAAENKRAFHALSRSFKLAGKRFGRTIGVLLLLTLIELVIFIVAYVPGVLLMVGGAAKSALFVTLLCEALVFSLFSPYTAAVVTALYRDGAARVPEAVLFADGSETAATATMLQEAPEALPEENQTDASAEDPTVQEEPKEGK